MSFKLSVKLPVLIVGLAILGLAVTSFMSISSSEEALEAVQSEKLEAVQEARISELSSYLSSIREDLLALPRIKRRCRL